MIISKLIIHFPWFYRLGSPLYYFTFAAVYIYARMVLLDEPKPRKTDWVHAIPAILHLVEMMPYYLKSNASKLEHFLQDTTNPLGSILHNEGWLPPYMHNLIRGFMAIIYAGLTIRMLVKARSLQIRILFRYPKMKQWLWVLAVMCMVFGLAFVVTISITAISPVQRSITLYLLAAGTQIVSGLYLLLNPSLLFGMPRLEKMIRRLGEIYREANPQPEEQKENIVPEEETVFRVINPVPQPVEPAKLEDMAENAISVEETKKEERNPLDDKNFDAYIQLLNEVMREKKPFLQKRYALNNLAADLKVPQHHLSYLLNNIFQVRFNDYINQLRIQYLKERLETEDLSHMTMEGLALEAGFSSRITFIRVVQKFTGQNPSAYFKIYIKEEASEI